MLIKQKLNGVATGAQANKIETVKVNGKALTPDSSKAVNVDLTAYAISADVTKRNRICSIRSNSNRLLSCRIITFNW